MLLVTAVRKALKETSISKSDAGTAELALTYARAIDDGEDLNKTGPLLLTVLESLLMTPRSRAAVMKGALDAGPTKSPLDELRAKRAARANRTASVDSSTS